MSTKPEDILRKEAGRHVGYYVQSIAESRMTHDDLMAWRYTRLKHVPAKITAYLRRELIRAAYRYTAEIYFVVANDGTVFQVEY
jgi:hypothetical protein